MTLLCWADPKPCTGLWADPPIRVVVELEAHHPAGWRDSAGCEKELSTRWTKNSRTAGCLSWHWWENLIRKTQKREKSFAWFNLVGREPIRVREESSDDNLSDSQPSPSDYSLRYRVIRAVDSGHLRCLISKWSAIWLIVCVTEVSKH